MPDHGLDFLARVEQDLPPIDWADADRVRHRGQARRSRRRLGLLPARVSR